MRGSPVVVRGDVTALRRVVEEDGFALVSTAASPSGISDGGREVMCVIPALLRQLSTAAKPLRCFRAEGAVRAGASAAASFKLPIPQLPMDIHHAGALSGLEASP
ncbi:hypothetical protein LMTR13_25520 [Bradyrhizobium icense]|uniref:Uncharacterized protein n=2 Tax=Bradyrhizobium icense TaxID=1274631 RepID=A0A1B1UJZ9_9BRAD|nr:hypothetical protein LMTR13_25520 [Bradyrhizobium icense]